MKRKMLVTNALPYANGTLHLGHLVGTIQGDIWSRLNRMLGHDCLYICGSDSHGTPIMIQAEKMGITPDELVANMKQEQERDFADFLVDFASYHTTHSEENKELVETIYNAHEQAGDIDKRTIKQLFDPTKKMFLPDRYVKGECPRCSAKDQYGDNCEVCGATYQPTELKNAYSTLSGSKPIEKESEHYFFKLQNYQQYLNDWTRKGHLQEQVTNKLDEWFQDGLREWDISRDSPYFGFNIPGTKDKYFYVWLDAPVGYIASFKHLCKQRKELDFDEYWKPDSNVDLYHFIGKDIIYFHTLFWPAMLHGAKFRTPTAIYVNGFLTIDGQKMSKSRGTFIKARTYLEHLNPEYLRYYFAAKLSSRIEDLDLSFDDFTLRVNSDLVGKFVNIASRCAGFLAKHFDNTLTQTCSEQALFDEFAKEGDEILDKLTNLNYSHAVRQIMALADKANQYIDEQKPWKLIKDPEHKQAVHNVCSTGINLFRQLMIYLKPILPSTAKEVEAFLNIAPLQWHDKDSPLLGHQLNKFKPLITRIDPKQIEAINMTTQQEVKSAAEPKAKENNQYINIDEFSKVDLRIAKVLEAEHVDGAEKLLRLKVDIGAEQRQIFAGIKSAYAPEDLVGRHVVVVANLAPRKMRFGISEGMVLMGVGKERNELWVISPDEGAVAGMKVQ